jgi:hypothetical protein
LDVADGVTGVITIVAKLRGLSHEGRGVRLGDTIGESAVSGPAGAPARRESSGGRSGRHSLAGASTAVW